MLQKTYFFLIFFYLLGCKTTKTPIQIEKRENLVLNQSLENLAEEEKTAYENSNIKVDSSLSISLWAGDELAPDPVAMSINEKGQLFLTRTKRRRNSEQDIRLHPDWEIPSLSFKSNEDRNKFVMNKLQTKNSDQNKWLKDNNGDGIHDYRDLEVESEEVWKLEDTNNDGKADISTLVMDDFKDADTDVAGGLLAINDVLYVGVAPDLWKLSDKNNDGYFETKESLINGFGVQIGFGGHGVSGAIMGPDGKIYIGIGDFGVNITSKEGIKNKYTNQGVIVRVNPDGSNFEVFCQGLRNTHEFSFDEYGNLISVDNDGDHAGERERLVHLIEGSDSGWRTNWQYGKYNDPKNNKYKVWMDEKLAVPHWEGQASYILPPIQNFINGPAGMTYNPGTALGKEWVKHFFVVEFDGNPKSSKIWAFDLKPKGASFVLKSQKSILSGILPTAIQFGNEGSLYVADWINGWETKNTGRVWKINSKENSFASIQRETKTLIGQDFTKIPILELGKLLSFQDYRIRLKAQFELVRRNQIEELSDQFKNNNDQLGKIHALWGLGQLAERNSKVADKIFGLRNSSDDVEIKTQMAKIFGDIHYESAENQLIEWLVLKNPRLTMYSAQALGRIKSKKSVPELIKIVGNTDEIYIKNAIVTALARIGDKEQYQSLINIDNPKIRMAILLAFRQMKDPSIGDFLNDNEELIVTEAARAINDDESIPEALPDLAKILNTTPFTNQPLIRRSLNANSRLGGKADMARVLEFAGNEKNALVLREEALKIISVWNEPSEVDRVDGWYRGKIKRDIADFKDVLANSLSKFINSEEERIVFPAMDIVKNFKQDQYLVQIEKNFKDNKNPDIRSKALSIISNFSSVDIKPYLIESSEDTSAIVRASGISLLKNINPDASLLETVEEQIFSKGSITEQRALINVLSELPLGATMQVIKKLVKNFVNGLISNSLDLELEELVQKTNDKALIDEFQQANDKRDDDFSSALEGGNVKKGMSLFYTNSTSECIRCHVINEGGGQVGPELTKIGSVLNRQEILDALVNPSKRIAPGYGFSSIILNDGKEISGTIKSENTISLKIIDYDNVEHSVMKSEIKNRENYPSSMPNMGELLSKRDIRDLVSYLSSLK